MSVSPLPESESSTPTGGRPHERNPGLELFFDLVFVLCVAQLADVLHEDPTWATLGKVLLLFVPVWWAWTGITFVLNRFPTDDAITNVALLLAAAASGAMALAIPSVPGAGNAWFALGYGSVRIILSLMYLRARSRDRRLASFYALGFGLTGAVWLGSMGIPAAVQPYVWAVAIVADISIPALADRLQRISPVDEHHLPDRFSAFAIIVLGESAVNTASVVHRAFTTSVVVVLAEGFVLSALLWWGFFDRNAWQARYRQLADHDNSGRIAYIVCAYLHFPLVAGVVLVGSGTQVAVEYSAERIPLASAALITAGIAVYLIALNLMTWLLRIRRGASLAWSRSILIAILGLWLWLGHTASTPVFIAGCAVILCLHVAANLGRARQRTQLSALPS